MRVLLRQYRILPIVFLSASLSGFAQVNYSTLKPETIKSRRGTICYSSAKDHFLKVPPPEAFIRWKNNPNARTNAATIQVTYIGFSEEAKQAFQYAVDIWESMISSPVTIQIEAHWTGLGNGVLGSASPYTLYRNFNGAQKLGVWYPIVLAEKLAGENLNGTDPDIYASFNSNYSNWHYNPSATPASGKYDLVTVVLHEIGHGLGFYDDFNYEDGEQNDQAYYNGWGSGHPFIYDVPMENGAGINLIETSTSPSVELAGKIINDNLYYSLSPILKARLYAPATFSSGSSIAHLNEASYSGSNALMTPFVAAVEQIHNPGISLDILKHMGWETIRIHHTPRTDSENTSGPYTITARIDADNGYAPASVVLHWTTNGTTYTDVPMTATGQANEFSGDIPGTGNASSYGYYISVENTSGTEYVKPGKFVSINKPQEQYYYLFSTGPDTQAPVIAHTAKGFILDSDAQLKIDTKVTDNLGIKSVVLDYYKNGAHIETRGMTLAEPEADSIYTTTINLTSLNIQSGDVIEYRITATDIAVVGNPNGNVSAKPSATGFYELNVVGLKPTQDSYVNDFNDPSDDFFGTGFSVSTPSGFGNGAIHSNHPYQAGAGQTGNEVNVIYQLKIPIRVKETDALIKFDEIVLVEPGESGSVFGSAEFYDYVVVEGSTDGGVTWKPVANGYDSRSNTAWLTQYNSSISGNNSTATGDPSLYRSRTLNLQDVFDTHDEVVIRFRLFSDELAVGWGWAIDNLTIQIDDTPPLILHDHFDFIRKGTNEITLTSKVSDASGVSEYALELYVNDAQPETLDIPVDELFSQYDYDLKDLDQLSPGDVIHYRFVAQDTKGNVSTFPGDGFIEVTVLDFGNAVNEYVNNFNSPTTDFTGNFFSITTPSGFSDGAIHTNHPYPTGMGLDQRSDFSFMLTRPIILAESNPIIHFKEIALVEGHSSLASFGTEAFNDYVIVEGSTDEGATWTKFEDGYDAVGVSQWVAATNNNTSGTPALFRSRNINMTASGDFQAGDEVLIRFRLFSDATINKWGWAIDDLSVQSIITGVETELEKTAAVYPNPARGQFTIEANGHSAPDFTIEVINLHGQKLYEAREQGVNGRMLHTISAQPFAAGMYIIKIRNGNDSVTRKIMRTN